MWLARTFDPRRQTPLVAASLRSFYEGLPYLSHARADVVHCQFGMLGLVALQLRELGVLDAPIVTSFRGYDASRYIQQHGPNVYADLFRRGEMFLPNCEHFRQRLIDLGCNPARIEIMRSGIDCSRFAAPALNTRPRTQQGVRLVAIGRLVEKKGFTDAIQAVEIARRDRADVTLQVIGDGPLRGDLQSQIDHLGLGEYVRLLGELDQDELIAVLHESDVLVAPSVRAADGDEDAPVNKLKEAMAMGLPVVATRHGGIGELIEDGVSGYLAPERDSAALADRIVRLIGEKPRWPAMGRAGRRRVLEQFDSEPLNDRLVELYEQIIRGSREGPTILPFARPQLQPQPTARGQHTKAA
jgi:colanic acid/amylovoran biosynthesis glycosyltransferase